MSENPKELSRRKMLARIGTLAAAAYTVPAFTTMSMAHASDGGSAASEQSAASSMSEASEASDASEASEASSVSSASESSSASLPSTVSGPSSCEAIGGTFDYEANVCRIPG